ncbi:hypothetical protein ACLMJK_001146 [Lecanora helva]
MKEPNGELFRKWQQEIPNEGIIRYLDVLNIETILPVSSKALAEVLVQKPYDFIKPPQLVDGIGRILGVGVFLAEGDEHKKQRKDLSPAFAFRHVKELYPVFWSKSRELVKTLIAHNEKHEQSNGRSPPVNIILPEQKKSNFENIGVRASEMAYSKQIALDRMLQALKFFSFKRNNDMRAASQVIRKACLSLIQRARHQSLKPGSHATDILSVAIESGGFSDEGLVNQLMTFLLAGHETTSAALTFAVCMMCLHPEMQTRLRREVRAQLPDPRAPKSSISSTMVDNLAYLNAFCNEVLRLYSPVPITVRVAAQDTSIVGQFIPKGTSIFLSPWANNISEELWGDDAHTFNPDRWMGPGRANTGGAQSNYGFMTFLQGPRSCIGQSFAKGEFACLVAAWVGSFETTFAKEDYEFKIVNGFTPRPKDLEVRLKVLEEW